MSSGTIAGRAAAKFAKRAVQRRVSGCCASTKATVSQPQPRSSKRKKLWSLSPERSPNPKRSKVGGINDAETEVHH